MLSRVNGRLPPSLTSEEPLVDNDFSRRRVLVIYYRIFAHDSRRSVEWSDGTVAQAIAIKFLPRLETFECSFIRNRLPWVARNCWTFHFIISGLYRLISYFDSDRCLLVRSSLETQKNAEDDEFLNLKKIFLLITSWKHFEISFLNLYLYEVIRKINFLQWLFASYLLMTSSVFLWRFTWNDRELRNQIIQPISIRKFAE